MHRFITCLQRASAPGLRRRSAVAGITAVAVGVVLVAGACSSDPSTPAAAAVDGGAAPLTSVTAAEQSAVRDASSAFASDLEQMQRVGSETLGAAGDVAGFYRSFADVTDEAAARYEALQLPAEIASVQTRLVALLDEQGTLLAQIADAATRGEDESLTPQLERLTELLGDVSTTNAELLRSTGVDAPGLGA